MIRVSNLHKRFKLYSSPADRLKELLLRRSFHVDYEALQNVSFEVGDGETLGIIGRNGAGKSTLLKILTGVSLPDSGNIDINGKITGLLELGTGFNPEQTGIQNIHDNGLLLNMTASEIAAKRDAIIDFSELGNFINEPIKTYSSGMVMRLAFSIAIHAEPKCFVVDEALSVGDAHFQQKCIKRIREFRKQGGSIIFVSHEMNSVKLLCDKAILLDHGKVLDAGEPENVINTYNFLLAKNSEEDSSAFLVRQEDQSYGSREAEIEKVGINGQFVDLNVVTTGDVATIDVMIRSRENIDDINVGILLRDRFGQDLFGTSLYYLNTSLSIKSGQRYRCSFSISVDLAPGRYTVSAAIAKGETHLDSCLHWHDRVAQFEVATSLARRFSGIVHLAAHAVTESLVA